MTEIAVISTGNFWELQDELARLPGVQETVVGYTGGTTARPAYHNKGDHKEALKIEFDTRVIGYEDILRQALTFHYGPAQRVAIFYTDETQRRRAEQAADDLQQRGEMTFEIDLLPLAPFYPAEEYNQHYLAKLRGEHRKDA